jgi:NitT/TauT family transport system permease protein
MPAPTIRPKLFGIHALPPAWLRYTLAALPFIAVISLYMVFSDIRHKENPADKLLPTFTQMANAVQRYAFEEDKRTGDYLLWKDTGSSLKRLAIGVSLSTLCALLLGLNMGAFKGMEYGALPFITFVSMIPPMAILPILFLSFGIDELGKIALIFLGTFPMITRDVYMAVRKLPQEQITKALTLGATQLAVVYKIILPQIMPRLLSAVRLSLGAAWLFLIAAEGLAATDGLGYRIFLVRRYLSMDVIIPYVTWITLLGFTFDYTLKTIIQKHYHWYKAE